MVPGERRATSRHAGGVAGRPLLARRGWQLLLVGEDPGVLGAAVEDLRADPVELAPAVAPAATPVRASEDGTEVPAAHVAPRAHLRRG